MKAIEKYVGIDVSLEESLFEYRLLVEDTIGNDKWIIIMLNDNLFVKTSFNFSGIPELLKEDYFEIDSFLKYVGLTENEFLNSEHTCQLYDIISYHGIENTIGSLYGYKTFTKAEICEYLGFDDIDN